MNPAICSTVSNDARRWKVGTEDGDGVHSALRVLLGAREAADDQCVEASGGTEEEPSLDRPLRDLDERSGVGKMTWVAHTLIDARGGSNCAREWGEPLDA
ncbi:MAG: hypothetical protein AAGC60_27260 [Acidobacteriota bacterium]